MEVSREIDLNADLGEGAAHDEAILACVSSVNIACGGHAGDAASMQMAVGAALRYGVAIGAHPSFLDRENFGRAAMHLPVDQVARMLKTQILALREIVQQQGGVLVHVKPHGALYNQAACDSALALVIVRAAAEIDPSLRIVGLAGSELIRVAQSEGMAVAQEVFADRRYLSDASLAPRSRPDASIVDLQQALQQVLLLIEEHKVVALDGACLSVPFDTICLHGDGVYALELAQLLRRTLAQKQIQVRPVGSR